MSSRNCLTLLLAAAASSVALGADPVSYSDPVGFVNLGNTTGGATPAVPPNTDVRLAIPLENEMAFSGTVASTTATTITVNGATWTANEWVADPTIPYCAIIGSGAENGFRGLISANGTDSLTITATTPGDLTNVSNGDTVRIRKCWTLLSLFADTDVANNCKVLTFDETETGVDHASGPLNSFTYFGGQWFDGGFAVSDNKILYPGELFIFRSSTADIVDLTIFGDVPLATQRVEIMKDGSGDEDLELALSLAVPRLISELTIPAENNDKLLFVDNDTSGTQKASGPLNSLTYFGGSWFNGSFADVTNSFVVQPGVGFKLRRHSGSTATPVEWTQAAD